MDPELLEQAVFMECSQTFPDSEIASVAVIARSTLDEDLLYLTGPMTKAQAIAQAQAWINRSEHWELVAAAKWVTLWRDPVADDHFLFVNIPGRRPAIFNCHPNEVGNLKEQLETENRLNCTGFACLNDRCRLFLP